MKIKKQETEAAEVYEHAIVSGAQEDDNETEIDELTVNNIMPALIVSK